MFGLQRIPWPKSLEARKIHICFVKIFMDFSLPKYFILRIFMFDWKDLLIITEFNTDIYWYAAKRPKSPPTKFSHRKSPRSNIERLYEPMQYEAVWFSTSSHLFIYCGMPMQVNLRTEPKHPKKKKKNGMFPDSIHHGQCPEKIAWSATCNFCNFHTTWRLKLNFISLYGTSYHPSEWALWSNNLRGEKSFLHLVLPPCIES